MVWLEIAICAAIIFFAGGKLSRFGDIIADKSGLSKNWMGLVLLAIIASSSQLIASVSAVTLHDLPDMAVGGLMGSCMFNMLVIGLLDLFSKKLPVSNRVHHGHILSAGFGIVLLGFAAIDMLFGKNLPGLPLMHLMDPITVAFVPVYLLAMRLTLNFEKHRLEEFDHQENQMETQETQQSWFKLIALFVVYGLLILGASCYLPTLAEEVLRQTHWAQGFVGLSFVAVTTCMPEIAVSTSAARRGSFDVAVASLLGSNLCYMVILAITDFCYLKEPLLRHVSSSNSLAALTAIVSMAIVIIALTYRAEKKLLFLAGDAVALVFVYLFANYLLFSAR